MEGAGVRRAVAEERDRDPRLVAQLEREPGADERRQAAADDRVRAEVAALDVVEVHRAAVAVRAALDLPVELGHQRVRVRPARERVAVGAVGGAEDVAVLHRRADADLGRLLADRDVQEPGKIAGAEALLDLLLETPDQEHLAQEVAEPVLGQGALLLDLRHGSECTFCARWHSSKDWQDCEAELPAGWVDARRQSDARGRRARRPGDRAARAAPAAFAPGRDTISLRHRPRRAPGRAPRRCGAALARLDAERLHGALVVGVGRASGRPEPEARRPHRACPSRGTRRSRRCRPTGATSSARSSSTPPTTSSRARCNMAPINPRRVGDTLRLQFRSASRFGYGASPGMVRRCLERCDAAGMTRSRHRPARALRHPAGRDAGARLADRRPDGLAPLGVGAARTAQLGAEALGERRDDALRRRAASSSVSVRSADW